MIIDRSTLGDVLDTPRPSNLSRQPAQNAGSSVRVSIAVSGAKNMDAARSRFRDDDCGKHALDSAIWSALPASGIIMIASLQC